MLDLEMIRSAQKTLKGVARYTPLTQAKNLGRNIHQIGKFTAHRRFQAERGVQQALFAV